MRKVIAVVLAIVLCLSIAVVAAADAFAPSVTAKPAPDVVGAGEKNTVEVKDESGKVVASVEAVKLEVTPVAAVMNEEAKNITEEKAEALKKVYEELSKKDADIAATVEGLEDVLKEQKIDASKLVVKDLFDISVKDEAIEKHLEKEGNTIEVVLKADIQEGQFVTVAVFKDGKWVIAENVVVNEDGTILVTLEYLGAVAIIVA